MVQIIGKNSKVFVCYDCDIKFVTDEFVERVTDVSSDSIYSVFDCKCPTCGRMSTRFDRKENI